MKTKKKISGSFCVCGSDAICATTLLLSRTCIANVRYEMELNMQRSLLLFLFPFCLSLTSSPGVFLHTQYRFMYAKFHTTARNWEQEIIAAIQFINCEWKLNMQRNFFSLSLVFFFSYLICCSGWLSSGKVFVRRGRNAKLVIEPYGIKFLWKIETTRKAIKLKSLFT